MHFESVYIGLGSNLSTPEQQICLAISALKADPDITFKRCSHLYGSTPMGPKNQPDYVNAVCEISTDLAPEALLKKTQVIELEHGRERKNERWGPRTLDLDILLMDDFNLSTQTLTIPHYGMATREFVLVPLFELAPDLVMHDKRPLSVWVSECSLVGLSRLTQSQDLSL